MRESPFKSARLHLENAKRDGPQDPDYGTELLAAKGSLAQAWGQAADDVEKSLIRYHLGLVALLRDKPKEAEDELRESYQYCLSVVGGYAEELNKPSVVENLGKIIHDHAGATNAGVAVGAAVGAAVTASAGFVLPYLVAGGLVVGAADKLKQARRNYRVGTMLESYAPFVNAVVRTLNAVVGNDTLPGLEFSGDTTSGYQLEWRADESGVW